MKSQTPENYEMLKTMAMSEENVMIHLEFEFGNEERPHACIKYPVTKESAIIAMVFSLIQNCNSDNM